MSTPRRPDLFALLLTLALLASSLYAPTGCGGGAAGGRGLDGALGPIPVFAPARKIRRSTAFTSDELQNPMKFSSFTWHFRTSRPADEIEAFYLSQWPGAGRVEDDEAVYLRYPALPADDAPLGESVAITIFRAREGGKTRFSISEDVFAERRP